MEIDNFFNNSKLIGRLRYRYIQFKEMRENLQLLLRYVNNKTNCRIKTNRTTENVKR